MILLVRNVESWTDGGRRAHGDCMMLDCRSCQITSSCHCRRAMQLLSFILAACENCQTVFTIRDWLNALLLRGPLALTVCVTPPKRCLENLRQTPSMKRAKHVISENARCRRRLTVLSEMTGGLSGLMDEGHDSLCDDYEVSSPELDRLVNDLQGRRCA